MKRVACAFSVNREFLELIDARAESLGLSRSAYIVQVLRKELLSGSDSLSIVAEGRNDYGDTKAGRKRGRGKNTV